MVVNVFLFDDFEVMDAFGPVEILGRVPEHFYVRFISLRGGLITGKQEIKFLLETDNGSNDTFVNSYELYYIGDVKPLPDAPTPASVGAVSTGKYRNLFKELGYSDAEIDKKVESAWQKFFYGTDEERIYYPVGEDMAYIYTADTLFKYTST